MAGGKGKIGDYVRSLSEAEQKANTKKAGRASGAARRQKKTFKDLAKSLMEIPLKGQGKLMEPAVAKSLKEFGFRENDMTVKTALMLALVKKGLDGNMQAIERLLSICGENLDNSPRMSLADKETKLKAKKAQAMLDWMNSNNGGDGSDSVVIVDDLVEEDGNGEG